MFADATGIHWPTVFVALGLLELALTLFVLGMILTIKHDSTSAVAWCLLVLFLPIVGMVIFYLFGYQNVHRPLRRKRKHHQQYRNRTPEEQKSAEPIREGETGAIALAEYAVKVEAFRPTDGNEVAFYHDGCHAYDAMIAAIESAKMHIHVEFFIFRSDATGKRFIDALRRKADEGVEVRLLYDAVGAHDLSGVLLSQLCSGGGKCAAFLSLRNPFRRFQINLRNHRKVVVVDGRVGFLGGLNVGDEYLGKSPKFGCWRDTFFRVEGPAVHDLQQTFTEDWDFASGEAVHGGRYYPAARRVGDTRMQVVASGPDQDSNALRQIYFAALTKAKKRIWLMTPYYVPDAPLREALMLAARCGVEVRVLIPFRPDKWIPFLAGRYYVRELLAAGVEVFQYANGFLHAKMMIIDDDIACVGSANFDNRSLALNFELNALFYDPKIVTALEGQFVQDLASSIQMSEAVFAKRPWLGRFAENAARLFSPVL